MTEIIKELVEALEGLVDAIDPKDMPRADPLEAWLQERVDVARAVIAKAKG